MVTDAGADQNCEDQSFMGSYYVLEIGNFDSPEAEKPVEPVKPVPSDENTPAGYYVLEVQNFDKPSQDTRKPEEKEDETPARSGSSMSQRSYENIELVGGVEEKIEEGYYDTPRNVYRTRPEYVNVEAKPMNLPPYENIQVPGEGTLRSQPGSAPISIPVPKPLADPTSQCSSQTSSAPSYENVELSSSQKEVFVVAPTPPIGIPQSRGLRSPVAGSYSSQSSSRSYENVEQAFSIKRGSQSSLNATGHLTPGLRSGSASPMVRSENNLSHEENADALEKMAKRRSRREEIYEAVIVGAKRGALKHKRSQSDPNASPTKLPERGQSFSDESSPVRYFNRSLVMLESSGLNGDHGDLKEVVATGLSSNPVELCNGGLSVVPPNERPVSPVSTKVIENSENPFAGLVISASKQLEESCDGLYDNQQRMRIQAAGESGDYQTDQSNSRTEDPVTNTSDDVKGEGGLVMGDFDPLSRGRAETIWDDDRVQQEWSQVRSVM